jgi:hypothetical protein
MNNEKGLIYGSSSSFIVNIPPVLEVKDYVTAYGHKVSAKFDFTDVPAKYHGIMLRLVLYGRCHVDPITTVDFVKTEASNRPVKKWWNKFLPNKITETLL